MLGLSYTPQDLRDMKLSYYNIQRPRFTLFESKAERTRKLKPYYDGIQLILRLESAYLTPDTKTVALFLLNQYDQEVAAEYNLSKWEKWTSRFLPQHRNAVAKLLERMEEGHADLVGEATEERNLLQQIPKAPLRETVLQAAAAATARAENWQNEAEVVLNRIGGERDYPPLKGTAAVLQGGEAGVIPHRVTTLDGGQFCVGFDLARVIGSGGFGTVFRAKRIGEPEIEYAIKFPSKGGLTQGDLIREKAIWEQLHHKNILKLEGTVYISGGLGLVSRFAAKGDLAARITDATYCDQQRLVGLRGISEAIEYLHHDKKVTHGDIKPANILLTSEAEALLCDFGLSKSPLYPTTSENHIGAGSADFVAPAQRISNGPNRIPKDEESDIFAFGMTMLQVISRRPIDLSNAELSIPQAACSDLGKAIWALGERCVKEEASHRPKEARVITERLKEMERGEFHKVDDWISQEVRRCS